MGNHFGNTPFCFWQHPLPLLGQHLSAELLALIPVVHGGYYSKGFLVALIPLLPWWLKEARYYHETACVFVKRFCSKIHLGNTLFGLKGVNRDEQFEITIRGHNPKSLAVP